MSFCIFATVSALCRALGAVKHRSALWIETWSLSRMSCDRHDHKKVEIVHPTNAYTADTCRVYSFSDYYQVDGYIGSAIFTCDATAR